MLDKWVYPRACGGTTLPTCEQHGVEGLSPRVRGNRPHFPPQIGRKGSIPARAGEPRLEAQPRDRQGVYPRACGGTASNYNSPKYGEGLSPRVRGNPSWSGSWVITVGSIPARAGEPALHRRLDWPLRVYPRACGGTGPCARPCTSAPGLSPRVRGNRPGGADTQRRTRSIPARAGEPTIPYAPFQPLRVYPRACGGTFGAQSIATRGTGLSPRVRGNRLHDVGNQVQEGSIPARAGEPSARRWEPGAGRVYPRACGGTSALRNAHMR